MMNLHQFVTTAMGEEDLEMEAAFETVVRCELFASKGKAREAFNDWSKRGSLQDFLNRNDTPEVQAVVKEAGQLFLKRLKDNL